MLEDCVMEKKFIMSGQPLGKGPGSDSKKSQDGSGGKAFPRSSRRRETPGTSAPKYDQIRKQTSQKGKAFDKKSRPRGSYMENRKESAQVAVEEMEYGSVISPGSKKQNLNHLLNFHYAPRQGASQHWRNSSSSKHASGLARYLRGAPHKYNKEQFLQANCQFVVRAGNDYRPYLYDPDQLVEWNMVEEIRVMSSEETSCPICLYPPVAAKMTRCGHIFCWACILHYLALSDKSWRKCPICYESVHKQDLKSARALKCTPHTVGGEITMRLMRRDRGSLEAFPVEQWEQKPSVSMLSASEKAVDTVFAKLLLADAADVLDLVESEKAALKKQMQEDEGSPEVCFIEQAMTLLQEREMLLKGKAVETAGAVIEDVKHEAALQDLLPSEETLDVKESDSVLERCEGMGISKPNRHRQESMSSEEGSTAITAEDLEHHTMQQPLKHFFFYQAMDGQHIYLHAINARMLEMGYGSLEKCPLTVTGRIVEKEMGSMTEELRRRLRYLQHLPITCQFEVVEINLGPPIISEEIVQAFGEQVEARRRRRNKRAREEWRREKKINEEENRRWGRHPTARIRIASHHHFPIYGSDSSPPTVTLSNSPSTSSLASVSNLSPPNLSMESLSLDPGPEEAEAMTVTPGSQLSSADSGPSFAQMLRSGKSSFAKRSGGAWGHSTSGVPLARSMLSTPTSRQRATSDSEPEVEGYTPVPTFSQSFSDAIAVALAKSEASNLDSNDGNSKSGKRKKKPKPKILFSTSMACSGK